MRLQDSSGCGELACSIPHLVLTRVICGGEWAPTLRLLLILLLPAAVIVALLLGPAAATVSTAAAAVLGLWIRVRYRPAQAA